VQTRVHSTSYFSPQPAPVIPHNRPTLQPPSRGLDSSQSRGARSLSLIAHAAGAVSELVFGKDVTLQTYSLDKYGHTIADVLLRDGTNVNHTLVKEG